MEALFHSNKKVTIRDVGYSHSGMSLNGHYVKKQKALHFQVPDSLSPLVSGYDLLSCDIFTYHWDREKLIQEVYLCEFILRHKIKKAQQSKASAKIRENE